MYFFITLFISLIMFVIGICFTIGFMKKDIERYYILSEVKAEINDVLYAWLQNKIEGRKYENYFKKHDYNSIAVYGFGDLGTKFVDDLVAEGLGNTIACIIDKDAADIEDDFKIVTPDERIDDVDAIVVTPIQFYTEIKRDLSHKVDCDIVSLEELIYEIGILYEV